MTERACLPWPDKRLRMPAEPVTKITEIVEASTTLRAHEEASPNLPGVYAKLERPADVLVRFIDAAGQQKEQRFEGLWATSVQHQIDHLNGRMYFDNLSKVKRDMLLRKARKLASGSA